MQLVLGVKAADSQFSSIQNILKSDGLVILGMSYDHRAKLSEKLFFVEKMS